MPHLDSKLPNVSTSIFTSVSRQALEMDAVNLGQGFPDFDPPIEFQQALARHVAEGKNQYAPTAGIPRLQTQIADKLRRDYGCNLDGAAQVTVTDGATEGIYDAITAVVRPGDEVIFFDPSYDSYEPNVLLNGGIPVRLELEADFSINWQSFQDALSERTRLVILNFPHNPSGTLLTPNDLDTLAEMLSSTGAFVLSDEVYEHIVFDGAKHCSLLGHPELFSRSFVASSFGKSFHTTGWKIGWVCAPPQLTSELRRVHQFVTFSTNTAAQHAFADLLQSHRSLLKALPQFYQNKRDLFAELMAPSQFRMLPTAATYFQLADYSAISAESDRDFAQRLLTQVGVAVIPLSPFYSEGSQRPLIRFCFAKNDATLRLAAEQLVKLPRLNNQ